MQNVFIGVILTATSVSITVETLKELGKLKTRSGNAILGAAVIDDILGIIALTLITSMADESVKISIVLLKIIGFFIFVAVAGFIFYKFFSKWSAGEGTGLQRHVIVSFVFCLLCGRTVFWRCRYHRSLFCRTDYFYDPERAIYRIPI